MTGDISTTDYVDVGKRAAELGYEMPATVALLPINFDSAVSADELIDAGTAPTVRLLFKEAGLPDPRLQGPVAKHPVLVQKSIQWIGPTIFIAAAAITSDPNIIAVALGVISNYLTSFFTAGAKKPEVELNIVVEAAKGKKYKCIKYNGSVDGLQKLPEIIKEASHDKPDD